MEYIYTTYNAEVGTEIIDKQKFDEPTGYNGYAAMGHARKLERKFRSKVDVWAKMDTLK